MRGRHRRRVGDIPTWIPAQSGSRPVGVTDACTRVEHLVPAESLAADRHAGRFLAKCGAQVLAASLTDPGRGRCPECMR